MRRIALRKHCSVEITIKPKRPRDICTCTFIGPENIVAELRTRFHSGQRAWDVNVTVRTNMETILKQTFPSPATSSKSDFSVECGVCYSYRLEDDKGTVLLPDTTCESCGQHYHATCIGEWLQALPSTRRSFNVLFGNCPYCTKPLSVQQKA
jgi:E3 ubiquitin-protein ligase FANCL